MDGVREHELRERLGEARAAASRCAGSTLNAATAGIATRSPMAVATRASAIVPITREWLPALRLALRQRCARGGLERVERLDDPDDGAEETDEGSVVSHGGEEREVALEARVGRGRCWRSSRLPRAWAPRCSASMPSSATRAAGEGERRRSSRAEASSPTRKSAATFLPSAPRSSRSERKYRQRSIITPIESDGQPDEHPHDPLCAEQREGREELDERESVVHATDSSPRVKRARRRGNASCGVRRICVRRVTWRGSRVGSCVSGVLRATTAWRA